MILVYSVVRSPWSELCRQLRDRAPKWCAPRYAEIELLNALWKHLRRGDFSLEDAGERYWAASALIGQSFDVDPEVALRIAAANRCSVYDARFVALADKLNVPLATYDGRILAKFERAVTPEQILAPGREEE